MGGSDKFALVGRDSIQ